MGRDCSPPHQEKEAPCKYLCHERQQAELSPHAVTVVAVTIPGQVVIIITGGVTVELPGPGAGLEAAALPLVTVVTVVVVREIPSIRHSSTQSLALLPCHDGAELGQQPVAPVTQRVDVEIIAATGLGCGCCRLCCRPLGCRCWPSSGRCGPPRCCSGSSRGWSSGRWSSGSRGGGVDAVWRCSFTPPSLTLPIRPPRLPVSATVAPRWGCT